MGKFLKEEYLDKAVFSDPSDCFGNFDRGSAMCFRWCAMRLACCIEHDKMEEDFVMEEEWQPMGPMIVH